MTEPSFLTTARAAYDTIADAYVKAFEDEWDRVPIDRAMMTAFADLVRADGGGEVLDVGSGPGETTAYLHSQGLDVRGLDLSPAMLAHARRSHPELRFDEGTMTELKVPDGSLAGISAVYCVIHIPDEELPALFAEFRRALRPGGHLLLIFMNLDEHILRTEAFGLTFQLNYYMRTPGRMTEYLEAAGFDVHAQATRKTQPGENLPRAMLLARNGTLVTQ
ncbi:class I SAM-dependent methyltransferase [Catellatospora sp. NPDC049609]|uniref:class I SAM-dependent methyltransferase n=1 Tax=Catellatospora sp. NPDC049609 TaxID=3155505 RepID=UPI00343BDE91